jgi:tetratricopeptide (TPR) repeat protein
MKRISFHLFLASTTFIVGISLTSFWLFKFKPLNVNPDNKTSCALTLANKITDPSDKAYSLAELAGIYVKAGNKQVARNLLFEALEITKSIEEPLNQAGAIWRISEAGEIEHLERGLTIARTVKDSKLHFRIWAYRVLSENFIRLERPDRAKFVLDEAVSHLRTLKYEDKGQKELNLSFLGQLYAQAGFCSDALKNTKGFENEARISEVKRETAICWASNKQLELAFATAKNIKLYQEMKVDAFLGMANVFVKNNNEVSVYQALAEVIKVARRNDWSNYDDQQASAFVKIAELYRLFGKDKESLKILEEAQTIASAITNPNFKFPALASISKSFAKTHSFDRAVKIALPIRDPIVLAEIARNMFEAKDSAAAQELLNQALELPNQTSNSLVNIAEIYAINGFHKQAVELLERTRMTYPYEEADYDKNSYPERMVSTYLKLKEYDLAFEVSSHLENRQEQLLAVADVENEMNKSKVINSDKSQEMFSQLGCSVK